MIFNFYYSISKRAGNNYLCGLIRIVDPDFPISLNNKPNSTSIVTVYSDRYKNSNAYYQKKDKQIRNAQFLNSHYRGNLRNFLFYIVLDDIFKRHSCHRTRTAGTGKPDRNLAVCIYRNKFYISSVGLKGRTHIFQGSFNFIFQHGLLLMLM